MESKDVKTRAVHGKSWERGNLMLFATALLRTDLASWLCLSIELCTQMFVALFGLYHFKLNQDHSIALAFVFWHLAFTCQAVWHKPSVVNAMASCVSSFRSLIRSSEFTAVRAARPLWDHGEALTASSLEVRKAPCDLSSLDKAPPAFKRQRQMSCIDYEAYKMTEIDEIACPWDEESRPIRAKDPEDCFKKAREHKVFFKDVRYYFFQYEPDDDENPVTCFVESPSFPCEEDIFEEMQDIEEGILKAIDLSAVWFWKKVT